jgi:hypothetical protein
MAQEERYDRRNRAYSAWHRRNSTQRYVGIEKAQLLAMIDLDASLYVEYDDGTKEPLVLIETAIDQGQPIKPSTVTRNLARRANMPAFVVLYTLDVHPNPADRAWSDIRGFRVRQLYPEERKSWTHCTPQEWAQFLWHLRAEASAPIDAFLDAQRRMSPESYDDQLISCQGCRQRVALKTLQWGLCVLCQTMARSS